MKAKCYYILLLFCLFFTSCAYFSPVSKEIRAEKKIIQSKEAIFSSEEDILKESRGYIYGASVSLSLNPETNKFTQVAEKMLDKAQVALGPPSMEDANKMTEIINGLISTNKQLIAAAESALKEKDSKIIGLQNKIENYELNLKKSEQKFVELSRENASMADIVYKAKSIFWWIIYVLIGYVVCKVLLVLVPPPFNSIFGIFDYIIGGFGRLVFKLAPKAMESAKVVSADVQTALNHVVTSVQEAKIKIDAKNSGNGAKSDDLETLKSELAKNTDDTSKIVITETKKNLGYI